MREEKLRVDIKVNSDPFGYSLWVACAAVRIATRIPTPFHQVMVDAGLWRRVNK